MACHPTTSGLQTLNADAGRGRGAIRHFLARISRRLAFFSPFFRDLEKPQWMSSLLRAGKEERFTPSSRLFYREKNSHFPVFFFFSRSSSVDVLAAPTFLSSSSPRSHPDPSPPPSTTLHPNAGVMDPKETRTRPDLPGGGAPSSSAARAAGIAAGLDGGAGRSDNRIPVRGGPAA